MDKRPKHKNRLSVSDAIYYSCDHYSRKDVDTAFRWAVEALRRAWPDRYLNPHEEHYLDTVIRHQGKNTKN